MRIYEFTTDTRMDDYLTFIVGFDMCTFKEFEKFNQHFKREMLRKKIRVVNIKIDADITIDTVHEVAYTCKRTHKNVDLIHDRLGEIAFSLEYTLC